MAETYVTLGGRELLALIRRANIGIPKWCEQHGLDRFQVQKVIDGEIQRVSVNLAFGIERATDGRVKASHFVTEGKAKRRTAA